jgi:hypothetical protein
LKEKFTIFYSWQSDLKSKQNRNQISTDIQKAIKKAKRHSDKINLEICLDRDTKNKSGSPSISQTIFEKIDNSDIFICDVTIINNNLFNRILKKRFTPNPNVLIELGYAVNLLGWERIICLNNNSISKNEELPFDIRSHRITNIVSDNNEKNINTLKIAIDSIIKNYENITQKFNENSHKQHDQKIYNKLNNYFTEYRLKESLSLAVNSNLTNQFYFDIWDSIENFYETVSNHFIDTEIEKYFMAFRNSICEFSSKCSLELHREDKNLISLYELEESGKILDDEAKVKHLFNIFYKYNKDPYPNETYSDALKRRDIFTKDLFETQKKVIDNHKKLIMNLKMKGYNL